MEAITARLRALADEPYRKFHSALMPTVDPRRVLGVRVPRLRQLEKELRGSPAAAAFLRELPHFYYEENNLHGLLICALRDPEETTRQLERFLPYVDNWATCDLLNPAAYQSAPPMLLPQIEKWLKAEHLYTVRFAMGLLMRHYLDDRFEAKYLDWVAQSCRPDYYLQMMTAWYFATALAKQWDAALPWLEEGRLDVWTHNKTIRKAIESYRIPEDRKAYLRSLTRRGEG